MSALRCFIGFDRREAKAYEVATKTLAATSCMRAESLDVDRLSASGLLRRTVDMRGRMYDFTSQAEQSTEFAISRFLVPIICQSGWAIFTDCDVVFLRDVRAMLSATQARGNEGRAVYVVKHEHQPRELWKMDSQSQAAYPRKNWSSVVLFNCEHPAHRRLNLHSVNHMPGRWLHAFSWLHDAEVGELPAEWNWLVGVQPKPSAPAIAHFTLGGPWLPGWKGAEHDYLWLEHSQK